jgi:capsular polysaccharide export protein
LPRNRGALEAAEKTGIHSFVLENGYLRPYWVTLERDGVNGFSRLPRDPEVYLDPRYTETESAPYVRFTAGLRPHVKHTIMHFCAAVALQPIFGFDSRYYGDSVFRQGIGYFKEYCWRVANDESQKLAEILFLADQGRKVFLALLQKPGDAQLVVHSRHGGNLTFLDETLASFAANGPEDSVLVVKQHPLDYGVERAAERVDKLVEQHGLAGRVFFLRKTSIDRIMPKAFAVVTINSTAGLAAVIEQKPVFCVGRAFYNIEGLTASGSLDDFWRTATPPSPELIRGFIAFLMSTSQFNGGFHTPEGRAILAPRLAQRLIEGVGMPQRVSVEAMRRASYAERHRAPAMAWSAAR